MKKLILSTVLGLIIAVLVIACKQPGTEKRFVTDSSVNNTDNVVKNIYTDDEFGDGDLEVVINHTKNTAVIHLEGQTYELKRSHDMPNYTAEDAEYRFSNIKGEITFLKKDYDMVLFHHNSKSEQTKSAKMVSY